MPNDKTPAELCLAAEANTGTCSIPLCDRPRHGLARKCMYHISMKYKYGSIHARPMKPGDYAREIDQVTEVILMNETHPGIQAAEKIIDGLLDVAGSTRLDSEIRNDPNETGTFISGRIPAHLHLKRLIRQGITAHEILLTAAAVHAHIMKGRAGTDIEPDLLDVLAAAIGSRVIYLRPQGKQNQVGAPTRRNLGYWLMERLNPLFIRMTMGVIQRNADHEHAQLAFRVPLMLDNDDDNKEF